MAAGRRTTIILDDESGTAVRQLADYYGLSGVSRNPALADRAA